MTTLAIRALRLGHFQRHGATAVELPERGVVLVTGENGHGKSSLLEAVSWAGWGKTMRGTPPWYVGQKVPCSAAFETFSGLEVERSRSSAAGRTTVGWGRVGEGRTKYESPKQAQEALEAEVGTWEVWRRSHVFTGVDAMQFGAATDSDRKRLLEQMCGLGAFDAALTLCRADLAVARKDLDAANRSVTLARSAALAAVEQMEVLQRSHTLALNALALLPAAVEVTPESPGRAPPSKLESMIEATREDIEAVRMRLSHMDHDIGASSAEVKEAKKRQALLAGDQCPTCEQPISSALKSRLAEALNFAERYLESGRARLAEVEAECAAEVAELKEELRRLEVLFRAEGEAEAAKRATARANAAAFKEAARAREHATHAVAETQERITRHAQVQAAADKRVAVAEAEALRAAPLVAKLEAVEQVLGLKGVRAQVLGDALVGVSAVASAWLPRLGRPDLTVELRPTGQRKDGTPDDEIEVLIGGAGGGHGYKAASNGERRRIDVAVMLGLAELGSSVDGTLWLDELLDGLDHAGVEAAADTLEDLATTRCVVVVSHNAQLEARLRPVLHLHLEEGVVRVGGA